MPTYKLTAFDVKARVEVSRLAFAVGGLKYEEVRVKFEEWPALKPKMAQKTLPVLEIDGKPIPQSMAIARYIGGECGLLGKTAIEQAEVNVVMDTCLELWDDLPRIVIEDDLKRKKSTYKKIMNEKIPKIHGYCEKMIADNTAGKGFLVGSTLSMADLALYDILEYTVGVFGSSLDQYPKVAANRKAVESVPRIAEYLKNRPSEDELINTRIKPAVEKCKTCRYKLIYFPIRGRAELARLVFAAADIDYEDCRISQEKEWPELKPKTPLGQLPVLEVDGEYIAESFPIARVVAKEAGMMGNCALEEAKIDMAAEAMKDAFEGIVRWYFEKDESKKDELAKKYKEETLPGILTMMEKMLEKNDNGFLVGDKLSLADIALYDGMQYPIDFFKFSLDKFPKTALHRKMVAEVPGIAEWLKKRPVTEH